MHAMNLGLVFNNSVCATYAPYHKHIAVLFLWENSAGLAAQAWRVDKFSGNVTLKIASRYDIVMLLPNVL